jgi:hypothetical protein
VGRRRREDVGEVGEEEQGREADEEELRAVHGAARRGTASAARCLGVSGLRPFRDAGLWERKTRDEASRVALPGGLAESKPAIWVPFVSGGSKGRASLVWWWWSVQWRRTERRGSGLCCEL